MNDVSTVIDQLAALPTGAKIALAVLYVLQLGLQIYALVNLWKTPAQRIQTGKKWIWVLVIVFVNLVGAIIYLVLGKKPAEAVDPTRGSAAGEGGSAATDRGDRAAAAADLLYGTKKGE